MENTETQTTTATQIAKKRGRPRKDFCITSDKKAYMKNYLANAPRFHCLECGKEMHKYAVRQHLKGKKHDFMMYLLYNMAIWQDLMLIHMNRK